MISLGAIFNVYKEDTLDLPSIEHLCQIVHWVSERVCTELSTLSSSDTNFTNFQDAAWENSLCVGESLWNNLSRGLHTIKNTNNNGFNFKILYFSEEKIKALDPYLPQRFPAYTEG